MQPRRRSHRSTSADITVPQLNSWPLRVFPLRVHSSLSTAQRILHLPRILAPMT